MRGDYADAAHWLKLSSGTTPAALWLKAKLERRNGRLAEAAKAMAAAWKTLRDEHAYTGWTAVSRPGDSVSDTFSYVCRGGEPLWNLSQEASGDFASFHLQRADFIQALDVFFKGELWNDAAYVAERVLTTDELKHYVDQLTVPTTSPTPAAKPIAWDWQNEIGKWLHPSRATGIERADFGFWVSLAGASLKDMSRIASDKDLRASATDTARKVRSAPRSR